MSVGLEAVREHAGQYLSQQYTNGDGDMIEAAEHDFWLPEGSIAINAAFEPGVP